MMLESLRTLGRYAIRMVSSPSQREWVKAMRAEAEFIPPEDRASFLMAGTWGMVRIALQRLGDNPHVPVGALLAGLLLPLIDTHSGPDSSCILVPLILGCCFLPQLTRASASLFWPFGVVAGAFAASAIANARFLDAGDLQAVMLIALAAGVGGSAVRRFPSLLLKS